MLALLLTVGEARAELAWANLNATRTVLERDWLRLKLEVLGLRLSYPAYRVDLKLSDDNIVEFTFLASSGLAEHLAEKVERTEAERVFTYHARGILDQVDQLIKAEFPDLWSRFEGRADFRGRFLGPGAEWDDPPRPMAVWSHGSFSWEK